MPVNTILLNTRRVPELWLDNAGQHSCNAVSPHASYCTPKIWLKISIWKFQLEIRFDQIDCHWKLSPAKKYWAFRYLGWTSWVVTYWNFFLIPNIYNIYWIFGTFLTFLKNIFLIYGFMWMISTYRLSPSLLFCSPTHCQFRGFSETVLTLMCSIFICSEDKSVLPFASTQCAIITLLCECCDYGVFGTPFNLSTFFFQYSRSFFINFQSLIAIRYTRYYFKKKLKELSWGFGSTSSKLADFSSKENFL